MSNPTLAEAMALDAKLLFRVQRERWRRDPAKLKMEWFVSFSATRMLTESDLDAIFPELLGAIAATLPKAKLQPEVHFDEDEPSTAVIIRTVTVVSEAALEKLNQQLKSVAGIKYEGVSCRLKDEALDADELFGQLMFEQELDPRTNELDWTFNFRSKRGFDQEIAQGIVDQIGQHLSATEDHLQAEAGATEDGSMLLRVTWLGTFTKDALLEMHRLSQRLAKSNRINYLGVNVEPPHKELSTEEGVQWADSVIGQTSRWELSAIDQVAGPIRKKHLSALLEARMTAANWMPTMNQRFPDARLRPKEEIVRRLMAAFTAVAFVCAPEDAVPTSQIHNYIKQNQLKKSSFSNREVQWMQSKRQDVRSAAPEAGWITENIWSLAWILGYKATPNPSEMQVSELLVPIRNDILKNFDRTFDQLMGMTKLRRIEQILTLEDLMYCAHNAYRSERRVEAAGLVQERRLPLTWALSPDTDWDDTDVST